MTWNCVTSHCCPLLYGLALLAMVQWRPFQVSMRVRETALLLV